MEGSLTALAWRGASTVVALLATDAWEQAKTSLRALWRRGRPEQADAVVAELTSDRAAVQSSLATGDESVGPELLAIWQAKLEDLFSSDPGLAPELQRLLDEELVPALQVAQQANVGTIRMQAKASARGRVYQAGRDQHIHES